MASLLVALMWLMGCGWAVAGPVKIAFVDTGNTGRSISAETAARIYALSRDLNVRFISRGVNVNPYFVRVELNAQILWSKRGVDLSEHVAQQLTLQDVTHSDVILTLSNSHKAQILNTYKDAVGKTFTLAEYAGAGDKDVEDAWEKPMDVYQRMLATLDQMVPAAIDRALAPSPASAPSPTKP